MSQLYAISIFNYSQQSLSTKASY